jgi:hypothetical protein
MQEHLHDPKFDEHPGSYTEKDPEDWVSGNGPMTGAQADVVRRGTGRATVPRSEQSGRIQAVDDLKARLGR